MSDTLVDASTRAERQDAAARWFRQLRDDICTSFESIERDAADTPLGHQPAGQFACKTWDRDGGGGGEISVMHGRVFEKVGVNISVVHGTVSEEFRAQIPGTEDDGAFWCGRTASLSAFSKAF